ncbi:MAG: hydroxymethylpyrimidine/phosphomethylpyrimidine kinase [Pseudomonadota bacterium]
MTHMPPIVLCFSGHDPSGGAGIQADIEALASHGCHACSIITAITDQDTRDVRKVIPQRAEDVIDQARTILEDLPVKAIKIGLLGNVNIASAIHDLLGEIPHLPVVLDPVLAAGGGSPMANDKLVDIIRSSLVPLTTVLTPNSIEARALAPGNPCELDACGMSLLNLGCEYVLITGAHEEGPSVVNTLYHQGKRLESFMWERLPHSYHGSGCTLAASIAAMLANGLDPFSAVFEAQEYTWNALEAGFVPGRGQHLPNRFYWAH